MDHVAIPEPAGFAELTKLEQVRYLQVLWDRIAEQPEELPVPDSHVLLVAQRVADYRRDPTRARPAFDALDRLERELR